ncbi:hypothetical protein AYO40_00115 [Planctomycetaceae bacterium SCGC AG-212-D15]|nr:hypothetical protein AYO40_00115 [Planctomycetaceae bacterium SCGC AG-212-D15]
MKAALLLAFWSGLTCIAAADPCVSGLPAGEKPGPYSSVICTGAQRGQSFCYICDNADRPAVVIFARSLSDPLGKLVGQLDKAVQANQAAKLNAWVTFLDKDQASLDPKVVGWGKKHAIGSVPLGVFEDEVGPPSYRLAADADVTVILFVHKKVVANFAFRTNELTDARMAEVMSALPKILPPKK